MDLRGPNIYTMTRIGYVQRDGATVTLQIDRPYRPALDDLEHFSHVLVFWWADAYNTPDDRARLHIAPPYAPDRQVGVFATRSPFRPNPIAMTICPIIDVDFDAGRVRVGAIDAFDGTGIVDLKAYLPICDRVKDVEVAPWLGDWPAWLPASGMRLVDEPA